jgi:hypothetical protein
MTLVKSLHSGDPDVIRSMQTCKASARQMPCKSHANAIRPTYLCSSCLFMYVYVTHAMGQLCRGSYVDVPNSH